MFGDTQIKRLKKTIARIEREASKLPKLRQQLQAAEQKKRDYLKRRSVFEAKHGVRL